MVHRPCENVRGNGRSLEVIQKKQAYNKTEKRRQDLAKSVYLSSEVLEGGVGYKDHAVCDEEQSRTCGKTVRHQNRKPLNLEFINQSFDNYISYRNGHLIRIYSNRTNSNQDSIGKSKSIGDTRCLKKITN